MSDLSRHSLALLSAMLARGDTTSRAIVDACLARMADTDGRFHAFVDVYADDARAQADAADRARATGAVPGPLHGLPIAFKDLLEFEGRQTTAGSKSWLGRRSTITATAVTRLLAAGMIPLGKTHMVEFAFGGWGRNAPMGAPWNPWDSEVHRVAGGSSSGSAVAVASGMVPAAIGSDTGGSIRIPSALCGLTGLKPTFGLISLYGAVPLSTVFDSLGPMAHTVEDVALLTDAMSGPDAHDPATLAAPRVDCAAALRGDIDVRGMRITALAAEQFPTDTLPAVRRARDDAIRVLRALGAVVEEVNLPFDLEGYSASLGRMLAAEAYVFHRGTVEDPASPMDPWVRKRMLGGKSITPSDFQAAVAATRLAQVEFAMWMRGRDALLTPTLPITAVPVEEVDEASATLAAFTRVVNYVGGCGLSLPAGFDDGGLPVGVQLIGAPFTEPVLIRLGRAFQGVTDWHRRPLP